ncbi:MAG: Nif3-like dinuclear metal center hexameric protein [Armatimonadota bacterium]|nr:MAG: Nif3-like dinuclear metal center hexameric protein [Armatimonadota bacterium]
MRAREVQDLLVALSPPLGGEEGFRFGDPDVETTSILVTWMATCDAIRTAADSDCKLIVCHEDPFFPYSGSGALETSITWRVNRNRMELLSRHAMTVLRAHGTLDRLCVVDEFARAAGLRGDVVADGLARTFTIPETTLVDLARAIKASLGMNRLRVVGDLARRVTKVGVAVGGIGLSSNISFWETLLQHGAEVVLTGESDEYAMRYAVDSDIGIIETTHPISENPGLRRFCDILRREFPGVAVEFYECGVPWEEV